jgi:hypothetical protein
MLIEIWEGLHPFRHRKGAKFSQAMMMVDLLKEAVGCELRMFDQEAVFHGYVRLDYCTFHIACGYSVGLLWHVTV